MTITKLTLSDYLAIEEIYEGQREFVDGDIIQMPPESNLNAMISVFLLVSLARFVPMTGHHQGLTNQLRGNWRGGYLLRSYV